MAKKRKQVRIQSLAQKWLYHKPYASLSVYDRFYIDLAREIFKAFDRSWFDSFEIDREELQRLACILASYFEDFINDIGIWKFFIETNYRLYGYYLPFYDLEDYEADYLNPQDISYLIWHWMCKVKITKMYGPDALEILEMGWRIYNIMEPKIEKAPLTTLYEDFFHVPDDIDFFKLKRRIIWMGKYCCPVPILRYLPESWGR